VPGTVDLNADAGEGYDDEALLGVVSSATLACGGHAGDPEQLAPVVALAAAREVAVGAQVSYADREGFGRRELDVDPAVLRAQLLMQAGGLDALCRDAGTRVSYVKPHGALYHRARRDPAVLQCVLAVCSALAVPLLMMPTPGVTSVVEGFADRGYGPDGLLPRSEAGAVLDAGAAAAQAVRLARSGVASVCVHSDTPGAAALARTVRAALEGDGWLLRRFT